MAKKEFIERDSTLLKMWNALYALEDEQEKQNGLDIMRRSDVQAGFEAGQSVVANEPAADVRPVVYCKDCRFFYNEIDEKCCTNHKGVVVTDENGYCHHGVLKEDENG